jgi:hypothetical protein
MGDAAAPRAVGRAVRYLVRWLRSFGLVQSRADPAAPAELG